MCAQQAVAGCDQRLHHGVSRFAGSSFGAAPQIIVHCDPPAHIDNAESRRNFPAVFVPLAGIGVQSVIDVNRNDRASPALCGIRKRMQQCGGIDAATERDQPA